MLLPVRWETRVFPVASQRPQSAINQQIVDRADIVIGLYGRHGLLIPGCRRAAEMLDKLVTKKPPVAYDGRRKGRGLRAADCDRCDRTSGVD